MYFDNIHPITLSFPQSPTLPQDYLLFPSSPLKFTSCVCVCDTCMQIARRKIQKNNSRYKPRQQTLFSILLGRIM